MKILKTGWILIREKSLETFFPFLQKTLARLVIFPDGEDLLTKYEREIKGVNLEKHYWVATQHGQDSFRWQIDSFGTQNMRMHCHVVKGLATREAVNNRYIFEIAMPDVDTAGMKLDKSITHIDHREMVITVTERESSTFMRHKCIHNVSVIHDNNILQIVVDHFKEIDKVDLSGMSYVTGEFNIAVEYPFVTA